MRNVDRVPVRGKKGQFVRWKAVKADNFKLVKLPIGLTTALSSLFRGIK
jgi:hypothetical protein